MFFHMTCLCFAHEIFQTHCCSFAHTLYVLQRLNTHSSRLVSNWAQSSSQIIVNKIDLSIFFFYSAHIFPSSSPPLDTSLHSLTPLSSLLCLCLSLFILSQMSLPRLPRAPSITACFFFSLLLCSSHSALKPCRNFSGSFDAWMSPVWVHLVWAAALALCDLNCAASLQVSLHGRLLSKRHFGHKLSGALIVKINSDQSRCCALSLSLSKSSTSPPSFSLLFCCLPSPLLALPPSRFFLSNPHVSVYRLFITTSPWKSSWV